MPSISEVADTSAASGSTSSGLEPLHLSASSIMLRIISTDSTGYLQDSAKFGKPVGSTRCKNQHTKDGGHAQAVRPFALNPCHRSACKDQQHQLGHNTHRNAIKQNRERQGLCLMVKLEPPPARNTQNKHARRKNIYIPLICGATLHTSRTCTGLARALNTKSSGETGIYIYNLTSTHFPCALSPESITASAPSYTAFVTSLTSALAKR